MPFSKDFLWGGATAANQCEGGYNQGGRGLANVDLVPHGKDRFPIITGEMKHLEFDEEHFYPAKEAIDMYHHWKEDLALFAEMGFKTYRSLLLGQEFFQKVTNKSQMKKACNFMKIFLENANV
ncbi:beta-galactosidase [Lactococcus lactis subsp. lactis]|nr:beta-galactosidase [Lactococcus lactis subsp. lactis]